MRNSPGEAELTFNVSNLLGIRKNFKFGENRVKLWILFDQI